MGKPEMQGTPPPVTVGETVVTVRELTVIEIRNWVASLEARKLELVDDMLLEDFSIRDLAIMTDQPTEFFENLGPSAIRTIIAAGKKVNPDFFGMVARIAKIGMEAARHHASTAS
jgi:hypothetical protein